jgi:hypothetical protein
MQQDYGIIREKRSPGFLRLGTFGVLSLDNFGSHSLYRLRVATSRICRRRHEAADLGRE